MKNLIASILALSLMGAAVADADVGLGAHVGGVHAGVNLGTGHHHHYRHCVRWSWHHHHRYCRRWGW